MHLFFTAKKMLVKSMGKTVKPIFSFKAKVFQSGTSSKSHKKSFLRRPLPRGRPRFHTPQTLPACTGGIWRAWASQRDLSRMAPIVRWDRLLPVSLAPKVWQRQGPNLMKISTMKKKGSQYPTHAFQQKKNTFKPLWVWGFCWKIFLSHLPAF